MDEAKVGSWYEEEKGLAAAEQLRELQRMDPDSQWHPFWAAEALLDHLQFSSRVSNQAEAWLATQLDLVENLKRPPGTEELYVPLQRIRAALLGFDRSVIMTRTRPTRGAVIDVLQSSSQHEWPEAISYGLCMIAAVELQHGRPGRALEALAVAYALSPNHRLLHASEWDMARLLHEADLDEEDWQRLDQDASGGEGLFKYAHDARAKQPSSGVELLYARWKRYVQR
jgi:hypothetical protein